MSTLDVEKFRKVRALMDRGATEGERASAKGIAEQMARSAGMTLQAACDQVDSGAASMRSGNRSMFEEIFGGPEWQAELARRKVERDAACAELLKVYGSAEAVFAETPAEAAMRLACEPFIKWGQNPGHEPYVVSLDGWESHNETDAEDLSEAVRNAISRAVPLPMTVSEAWTEFQATRARWEARNAFSGGEEYYSEPWVAAREYIVASMMEKLPATSVGDIEARAAWLEWSYEDSSFSNHTPEIFQRLQDDARNVGSQAPERRTPGEPMSAYVARFFCGFPHRNGSEKQP